MHCSTNINLIWFHGHNPSDPETHWLGLRKAAAKPGHGNGALVQSGKLITSNVIHTYSPCKEQPSTLLFLTSNQLLALSFSFSMHSPRVGDRLNRLRQVTFNCGASWFSPLITFTLLYHAWLFSCQFHLVSSEFQKTVI